MRGFKLDPNTPVHRRMFWLSSDGKYRGEVSRMQDILFRACREGDWSWWW